MEEIKEYIRRFNENIQEREFISRFRMFNILGFCVFIIIFWLCCRGFVYYLGLLYFISFIINVEVSFWWVRYFKGEVKDLYGEGREGC